MYNVWLTIDKTSANIASERPNAGWWPPQDLLRFLSLKRLVCGRFVVHVNFNSIFKINQLLLLINWLLLVCYAQPVRFLTLRNWILSSIQLDFVVIILISFMVFLVLVFFLYLVALYTIPPRVLLLEIICCCCCSS